MEDIKPIDKFTLDKYVKEEDDLLEYVEMLGCKCHPDYDFIRVKKEIEDRTETNETEVATEQQATEQQAAAEEEKPEAQEEIIDRITVKDGSRIHIIKVDELLYIQACGDYATLVTPTGEYIKEQTMKYFEGHLPTNNFVRIHRSTIVNVTQISRVELFGKETYQVLLKNGTKLRVSLTGYRLLKERLGI